jgi:hypothetical protein
MRLLSVARGERMTLPNGSANYILIAEIKGTLDYEGTNYAFEGRTVEISVVVPGIFRGSQAAGGVAPMPSLSSSREAKSVNK